MTPCPETLVPPPSSPASALAGDPAGLTTNPEAAAPVALIGGKSAGSAQVAGMKHVANDLFDLETVPAPEGDSSPAPGASIWSAAGALLAIQEEIPPPTRAPGFERQPLSFAQERLWCLENSEPGTAYFNVSISWDIRGELDAEALEKSLDWIAQRHEVLRTSFPEITGGPVQRVGNWRLKLARFDLTAMPPGAGRASALEQARGLAVQPFDLAGGPLLRAALFHHRPQDWLLVMVVHQMIFDGASMRIFSRELTEAYRAFSRGVNPEGTALPVQYCDFARWQRAALRGEILDRATCFWRGQFERPYEPLWLPLDRQRCPTGVAPGKLAQAVLPKPLAQQLKRLGRAQGLTPFAALLGSFQAFLGRISGRDDVLTLVSVAGRAQPELRNLIGLLANVLPMRLDLSGGPDFVEALRRAGAMVSSALAHQILPLGRILELLPSPGPNIDAPVLQALVLYNAAPLPVLRLPTVTFTPSYEVDNGMANFELALDLADSPQGIVGHLRYRSDLFDQATVERFIEDWRGFIQAAMDNPNRPLCQSHFFNRSSRPAADAREGLPSATVEDKDRRGQDTPDALEQRLTRIWESVFGISPIGLHDSFFGLGGHSLVAVKLVAAIEKELGRKLRLSLVFQAPTIARLARAMRETDVRAGSSIVEIQAGGRLPSLYLVHGVGGGMFWGYSNLARHLGPEQPIYAFRSRGMDGQEELADIETMAAQYVTDLRQVQPSGPYFLGGYCFGGNVAYEMARQLIAQNQEVALLLLINCWSHNSSYTRLSWTPAFFAKAVWNFCLRLEHQIRWGARQPADFIRWRTAWIGKRLKALMMGRAEGRIAAEDLVDLSSHPDQERKLWRHHVQAWIDYRPSAYPGHIVLFRTRGHPILCSFDHQMGWGSLAAGGVTVKVCPGDHESILEEENAAVTARELKAILEQARRK
jgi:thioesterase domain-containing protein/acyl carrier protein